MEFSGKGGKRPLIDINIDLIELDQKNPRLTPYILDATSLQQDILTTILYEHFDSESIALSMIQNGYFDEEPIVVVPVTLPGDFDKDLFKSTKKLTTEYNRLISEGKITFRVIEGNRRVSAIKLLTDQKLRKKIGVEGIFPVTSNKEIIADISNVPCIIYPQREDVFTYLGIRHISGNLKWEAFAQAVYTTNMINAAQQKGNSIQEAIKEVQSIIAHRSDKLFKQFIAYKLFLIAKEDLEFDVRPIINKFSLLIVAYNTASIRSFIGIESYSKIDFSAELIGDDKYENFRDLLTWIYGDKNRNKKRVLTDSRKITSTLSHVVKVPEAVEYLNEHEDLEGAYERTSGERDYLIGKVRSATRALRTSLKFAYKYKDDEEILEQVDELIEITDVLKSNLTS